MTVPERSLRNGDARWVDGASVRSSATLIDGEEARVLLRRVLVVLGTDIPDEARLDGSDYEDAAQSIRPWVVGVASVADRFSDDSRPDHVHAVERPHDRTSGALRQGVDDEKTFFPLPTLG
jgi:hypothetical protein